MACAPAWGRSLAEWLSSASAQNGLGPYAPLLERLAQPRLLDPDDSALVDEAAEVWARPGFETFLSPPHLRFVPFPHQLQAASTALRAMHGRAILADEVGLGKTIEAGLVLSELHLRRLARRVLILTPAGLVEQWHEELDRKFGLPVVLQDSRQWRQFEVDRAAGFVLLSLAAARRVPLATRLSAGPWDLVIVDEAHRLKQPRSASAKLVRSLLTRYLLLLTATPVENRLDDLFQLVSLVRPGHLGSLAEFRRTHGTEHEDSPPRDLGRLRARAREVMVRHRRSEVKLMLPRRLAETIRAAPGPAETNVYRQVSGRVRDDAARASRPELLGLRALQRLAGSSPRALAPSLERRGWTKLAALARSVGEPAKTQTLLRLLHRHLDRDEKVIVFTAFRQTLDLLREALTALSGDSAVYHGGLSRREKEDAIRRFRDDVPILLTTEAAGEGRNLQFAHVMVNYDLPWNPMEIEQRLGRIHRIGQEHDVTVVNLTTVGTIEDRMLSVLERKINLFELVVGELDLILGRIEDDFDFESFLFRLHVEARDEQEFGERLDTFGEELAEARQASSASRQRNDRLMGDR